MKKALISLRSYGVLLLISGLALSLVACGGARETTLKFPKLDEPKPLPTQALASVSPSRLLRL